jgi:N-methylhydantoinase A
VRLDEQRTRRFLDESRGSIPSVEEFATGIVRVAEAEMEKAIRLISVERGYDPREFTLVCFGGAGPLHACSLARALGIPRVLVPAMPGALSALGILMSDMVRDYSRTVMIPLDGGEHIRDEIFSANSAQSQRTPRLKAFDRREREIAESAEKCSSPGVTATGALALLEPYFAELEAKGAAEFREQGLTGVATRSADLRYVGQGYELNVAAGPEMLVEFHATHRRRYGHADGRRQVEVVNVRVRMVAPSDEITLPRKAFAGPDCTQAILKQKRVMFHGESLDTPVFQRNLLMPGNRFEGPAIVHEYSATTVIPPACTARVDEYSNMVIEV